MGEKPTDKPFIPKVELTSRKKKNYIQANGTGVNVDIADNWKDIATHTTDANRFGFVTDCLASANGDGQFRLRVGANNKFTFFYAARAKEHLQFRLPIFVGKSIAINLQFKADVDATKVSGWLYGFEK